MKNEDNNVKSLTFDFDNVEVIKTGLIPWDAVLNGGLELPTTIQLVGESSSGKTTLALQLAYHLCCQNRKVLYLDTEATVTKETINNMNLLEHIKNNNFYYVRETSFKEVEKILDEFISKEKLSLIIVDSINSLINPCYLDLKDKKKESTRITNYNTNFESRPLGLFIKKYTSLCNKNNIALLMINQYRNKIHKVLGTIKKRSGPKIVDYSSNVILQINDKTNYENFKTPSVDAGVARELEIVKSNKVTPNVKVPYYLEYGKGISQIYNLIHYMLEMKCAEQNGTHFKSNALNIDNVNGIINFADTISKYENQLLKNFYEKIIQFYKK